MAKKKYLQGFENLAGKPKIQDIALLFQLLLSNFVISTKETRAFANWPSESHNKSLLISFQIKNLLYFFQLRKALFKSYYVISPSGRNDNVAEVVCEKTITYLTSGLILNPIGTFPFIPARFVISTKEKSHMLGRNIS